MINKIFVKKNRIYLYIYISIVRKNNNYSIYKDLTSINLIYLLNFIV